MVPVFQSPSPASFGASELKAVARSYMLRAILAGSGGWVLATLILAAGMAWFSNPEAVRMPRIPNIDLIPPPRRIMEQVEIPRTDVAAPAAQAKSGEVMPVVDTPVSLETMIPNQDAMGTGPAIDAGLGDGISIAPPSGGDALPKRGEYVYVEELPELITDVSPVYPELAKQAGVSGTVVVHVLVGIDGRVRSAEVEPNHSVPMLNQAARDAALQLVFKPALVNDRPVAVWIVRQYRFRLH